MGLGALVPSTSAPASSVTFSFYLDQNIHAFFSEKIDGPLAHVFKVGAARRDDMDYAQNIGVGLFVCVVVVVAVAVGVVVIVTVVVTMTMTVVMTVFITVIVVVMAMVMAVAVAVAVAAAVVVVRFCRIVEPEFGNGIPYNTPQGANAS